jgi:Helix-turn-helix domain
MHSNQQLEIWRSWAAGEIDDDTAQATAAAYARKRAGQSQPPARPQNERAAFSESRRPHRREKLFGDGRPIPLDRNGKVRVMMLARALMRRTEPGKAYGTVTAKALAVLQALLWSFHNAASGRCFPSYETIAERAACSRTTVYSAIRTLEQLGILTWINRIKRVREWMPGLFGKASAWRWRVVRTSNAYAFTDPQASKFNFQTGTATQATSKKSFASNEPSEPLHPSKSLWTTRSGWPLSVGEDVAGGV